MIKKSTVTLLVFTLWSMASLCYAQKSQKALCKAMHQMELLQHSVGFKKLIVDKDGVFENLKSEEIEVLVSELEAGLNNVSEQASAVNFSPTSRPRFFYISEQYFSSIRRFKTEFSQYYDYKLKMQSTKQVFEAGEENLAAIDAQNEKTIKVWIGNLADLRLEEKLNDFQASQNRLYRLLPSNWVEGNKCKCPE